MAASTWSARCDSRRGTLAAGIASIFALSAPAAAIASTIWTVTSCLDDDGPGTLRSIINDPNTLSDDFVSFGFLSCPNSTITLATGGTGIEVFQDRLTIVGGIAAVDLTIDGSKLDGSNDNYSNVFYHFGSDSLTLSHVKVTGGHQSHRYIDGLGGCIYSKSNAYLYYVTVSSCSAYSAYASAKGGGIFARGNVRLVSSNVTGNSVSAPNGSASGGGVWAGANTTVLAGPSMQHSTISGNSASSSGYTLGGGIYAKGNLSAEFSTLSGNTAAGNGGYARGGGLYVGGEATASSIIVSDNIATTFPLTYSAGGGAYVAGNFAVGYSTVSGNRAGFGGGLVLLGLVNSIAASTVSGNRSYDLAGGVIVPSSADGSSFLMKNSTISNNVAGSLFGGLSVRSRTAKFYNSTIAFNSATDRPGVSLGNNVSAAVTLQSTLMSNNVGTSGDLAAIGSPVFNGGNLAAPANNLVRVNYGPALPADTVIGVCPLLGPLRDNGGPTQTHAFSSSSAAIDAGNNVLGSLYDQRGPLSVNGQSDYLRLSGAGLIADIGAYEVQQDDIVFNTGFEDCPPIPNPT